MVTVAQAPDQPRNRSIRALFRGFLFLGQSLQFEFWVDPPAHCYQLDSKFYTARVFWKILIFRPCTPQRFY